MLFANIGKANGTIAKMESNQAVGLGQSGIRRHRRNLCVFFFFFFSISTPPCHSQHASGYIRDQCGNPIGQARICLGSDSTSCTSSRMSDGYFASPIPASSFKHVRNEGLRIIGDGYGKLSIYSPLGQTIGISIYDTYGRRVYNRNAMKLDQGFTSISSEAMDRIGEGVYRVRMVASAFSTMRGILRMQGQFYNSAESESPVGAIQNPLKKRASGFDSLLFSKDGYVTKVYYPSQETESGVVIELSKSKLLAGKQGFSKGEIYNPDLEFDSSGILHVGYQEAAQSQVVVNVKKFEGHTWTPIPFQAPPNYSSWSSPRPERPISDSPCFRIA
jgi:hypothetical protein